MELFCDAGLVIKHPLATAAHYEMRTDTNPKAYIICRQCNTITKVSTSTAKLALQSLHVRYFAIEDKLLYALGAVGGSEHFDSGHILAAEALAARSDADPVALYDLGVQDRGGVVLGVDAVKDGVADDALP